MKVIKSKYYPDVEIERSKSNIPPHHDFILMRQDTEVGILIEIEKLKSLIEFLQKEVEKNDTE